MIVYYPVSSIIPSVCRFRYIRLVSDPDFLSIPNVGTIISWQMLPGSRYLWRYPSSRASPSAPISCRYVRSRSCFYPAGFPALSRILCRAVPRQHTTPSSTLACNLTSSTVFTLIQKWSPPAVGPGGGPGVGAGCSTINSSSISSAAVSISRVKFPSFCLLAPRR